MWATTMSYGSDAAVLPAWKHSPRGCATEPEAKLECGFLILPGDDRCHSLCQDRPGSRLSGPVIGPSLFHEDLQFKDELPEK
jgi:hypothetical protein